MSSVQQIVKGKVLGWCIIPYRCNFVSRVGILVALLILQAFCRFTYVTTHSPTLPLLYLRHSLFSNPSVALPASQLILQPFFCFSNLTGFPLTSPGEPPMTQTGAKLQEVSEWPL